MSLASYVPFILLCPLLPGAPNAFQAAGPAPCGLSTVGPAPPSGAGHGDRTCMGPWTAHHCGARAVPRGSGHCLVWLRILCVQRLHRFYRTNSSRVAGRGHLKISRLSLVPHCPRGSLYPSPNTACPSSPPLCATKRPLIGKSSRAVVGKLKG